ncbi:MAG: hypothetical protein ABI910_18835 [Gemmatimonadota bacterium]
MTFPALSRPRRSGVARRALLLALTFLLPLACSDAPLSPTAPRAPVTAEGEFAIRTSNAGLSAILDDLARAERLGGQFAQSSATAVIEGRVTHLAGPSALRAALRAAVARPAALDGPRSSATSLGAPTAFGIPYNGGSPLSIGIAASAVLASAETFRFSTITTINQTDPADYTHRATRAVSIASDGALKPVWSDIRSETRTEWGGVGTSTWPAFTASSGCVLLATMQSDHTVVWPSLAYVPSSVRQTQRSSSNGRAPLTRACSGDAPPPPPEPVPSYPYCDDPDGAGCAGAGHGSNGPYSGGTVTREVGRSGGFKTVCYVTDWYENGRYIETTIDRCWSEPFY